MIWVLWALTFFIIVSINALVITPLIGSEPSLCVTIITGGAWGYLNPLYFRARRERRARKNKRGFE